MSVIHYVTETWPSIGGVARYDTHIQLVFPDRKFFNAPEQRDQMIEYLKTCDNPVVLTDNHHACDVPNAYPVIIVHHGCAMTTAERNQIGPSIFTQVFVSGQIRMLEYRNPENTWILSISKACTDDFTRFCPVTYPKFKRIDLLHSSDFSEAAHKKNKFNVKRPRILGNWNNIKKGGHLIPTLTTLLPEFEFVQLCVLPRPDESLKSFNVRKQVEYLKSDMFLQVANSEGFSYASQDAMICGLVPVCTNVGGFYGDVPDDCFTSLEWTKCYGDTTDYVYLTEKIRDAWENREKISKNAREWYMTKCRFEDWATTMKSIVASMKNKN